MSTIDPSTLPYRPCVGVVLINTEGRVFVGERIDTPDAWQMPQGGIDKGEEPEAAALRELWEETGVRAEMVEIIGETPDWVHYDLPEHLLGKMWKGKYRGQKQKWFAMRFLGTESDIAIDTAHPEFSQWKWTDRATLLAQIVSFKRDIYAQVATEFSDFIA